MNEKEKQSETYTDALERRVLANMVQYPEAAFRAIEDIGICREDFSNPKYASAFAALLECGPESGKALNAALMRTMGEELKGQKKIDAFLDLAVAPYEVNACLVEFAQHAIALQSARKTMAVYADPSVKPVDIPDVLARLNDDARTRMDALERFRMPNASAHEDDGGFDETKPTPVELMDMPGFVHALAEHTYATAPRPNRALAFAGALAMLAHLVARKFTDARRTMTNLYLVALADSGVGKDHPRRVNKALADAIEALDGVAEQIGSGEGLEDALFQRHAMLFQMDEFDTLLNVLKEEGTSIAERIYGYVLTFFSESATSHALRRKALSQEAKESMAANPTATAKKPTLKIYNPSLSLFATAIPRRFYSSLSMRALDNGLLARCLILEAGVRGPAGKGPFEVPLPAFVTDFARTNASRDSMMQWGAKADFYKVPDAPGTAEEAERIRDEADALYDQAAKAHDTAGKAVWNRGYEITCKLALLYALSENLLDPHVTPQGFAWAWQLVRYSSKRMLAMAAVHISTDRDDEDCNAILRYLGECEGGRANRSEVARANHLSKVRMDRAEDTLVDQRVLKVTPGARGATIYRLVKKDKKEKGR